MKIKPYGQIAAGLSLVILICAVSALTIFFNLHREETTSNWVSHSQEEIEHIESILFLMQDCETGARGFVISNDERFREPFKKAVDSLPKVLAHLKEYNKDDILQQKYLASLSYYLDKKIQFSHLSINTRKEKGLDAALQLVAAGTGKKDMDSIRSLVDRMLAHENSILGQRKAENQKAVSYTNVLLLTIVIFFLVVLFVFARKVLIHFRAKKAAEEKLHESNERFNLVSEATVDAIWDWELKTGTVFWGDNFELLFGYTIQNNKGDILFWEDHIHPEDKQRVVDGIHNAIPSENKWQDEYRFLKADGTYAYVLDKAVVIRDETGEPYRMTGSMRDITERKEAEIKVQESEARYRQIVETAHEGIWMVDGAYRTLFVNKKMYEMLEYTAEEMIGRKNSDFMDEGGKALLIQSKGKQMQGTDKPTEIRFITKSGKAIHTSLSITTNLDSEGNLVNGMAMVTDITNRKRAEEKLKQSEARFRLLIDNVKDHAIFIVDTDGLILTWNSGAEKMKGYSAEEIIGKHISVFYTQEQRNNKEPEHNLEMAKKGSFETEGYRSCKNGTEFWADVVFSAVYDDDGKLYGFAKITRDVTEKRLAEKKIKEVTDRLTLATSVSNIGVWEWDLTNNHLEWDETMYRLFGVAGQIVNDAIDTIELCLHPDDKLKTQEAIQEAALHLQTFETEFRVVWEDQSVHYIVSSGMVQRDAGGNAIRLTGINMDITERKKTEENKRALHKHIQLLLASATEGLYGIDNTGKCTFINKAGAFILGYQPADCIGKDMHQLIHYKKANGEALPVTECAIYNATTNNQSCYVDSEVFWRADGSCFDVQYSSNPIIENGEIKGAVVTFSDITKRKLAEQQLIESERNLHAILLSSQEALYLLDTDFRLVLMNEASHVVMRRMTNKECEPGQDFLACFNPETQRVLQNFYTSVLQGQTVEVERQTTENGQVFYHSATYFPVKDDNGVITNICCTSKNITEKKLTQEIINAANAEKEEYQYRYQAILDNSPQAVLIKDVEGHFTFINKTFLDAFGIDREEIIGKRPQDIFTDPTAVAKFEETDEEVLAERKIIEWEQKMMMRNGEERHVEITKFPLYDRKQMLFGIGTICKDITDIKNYQQDLIKAREKAESAERLQEQFLANMSHELRTPMNGIIGMANVLSNTELQPQQKEQLNVIQQSSDTLLNLINDILDLSKIKAGMLSIEKVDFDFNETIAVTASVFKEKTLEKGIRFTVQTEPFIPRFLSGDPHRLIQILNNLLSNAIKFTEKGFVKLEASLLHQSADDMVIEFVVSDSGIGIEQNSLEAIFNTFQQASSDISRKYGGTGLGLPITKRLIELQGGEITVESNPGIGSVFTFSLPYSLPKNTPAPVTVISQNQKHITPTEKKDYSGKHVLIAEDNEINQDVLAATLKQYKLTFTIANNGKEAVELIETGKHFDLVFMDLRMPVMNGFQATAYIREKLQLQIPIVILTASVLRNEREKCLSIGANDYMSKPFNHVHLDLCLQKYLREGSFGVKEESESAFTNPLTGSFQDSYNLRNLLELEDAESIRQILQLFIKRIPQHLNELRSIVFEKNLDEFLEKTHKFKGGLSIIQIPEIYHLAITVESIALDKKDLESTLPILDKALAIYTNLIPEICQEVEKQISSRKL
ncbi:MAG: domain S-box protein [Segetibacter sp.]|nr:domain S-box protein [Segetibacter sp.]